MREADVIEARLHRDRCTVLRSSGAVDGDGITRPTQGVEVYGKIPCKVSRGEISGLSRDGQTAQVAHRYTLHLHPRYVILPGDELLVELAAATPNQPPLRLWAGGVHPTPLTLSVTATQEVDA